ncbi:unnamed protein product, partial [Schistosoma curassoni]|uniref:Lyase_1 domain-containing protein n=1 Tax=Schistosoma curassoni TaxID=6186 RepID=A0A183L668_9TREM
SCISAGGGVSDEINARIAKARTAYANLGRLLPKTRRTLILHSLGSERIIVEKSMFLCSCISAGGRVRDEINPRIMKAKAAYGNVGHLRRLLTVYQTYILHVFNPAIKIVGNRGMAQLVGGNLVSDQTTRT